MKHAFFAPALAAALAAACHAGAAAAAAPDPVRSYAACLAAVDADPEAGREAAAEWVRFGDGGVQGMICEAAALSALGAHGAAAGVLDEAAALRRAVPAEAAALWSMAASFWLAAERPLQAAASADAALAAAPEGDAFRGEALLVRGLARLGADAPEAAAIDLTGALGFTAQAEDPAVWTARARARNRMADAAGAAADAREALGLAPDLPPALLELGRAQLALGESDAARETLLHAARADGPPPGGPVAAEARRLLQQAALGG